MLLTKFIAVFLLTSSTAAASILLLSTKGRDIIDATGHVFLYKSTNWPGHQKTMIPEGPQHSSVQDIVSWIPK
jgi:endoglucanase